MAEQIQEGVLPSPAPGYRPGYTTPPRTAVAGFYKHKAFSSGKNKASEMLPNGVQIVYSLFYKGTGMF